MTDTLEGNKLIIRPDGSSFCFSWIEGVKTINIHHAENPDTTLDCISFDHHLAKTTLKRAKQVIKQWRKDNGDFDQ